MKDTLDPARLLFSSPIATVGSDPDGRVFLWNPAATRLFGWTEMDVIGKPVNIVPQDVAAEETENRRKVLGGAEMIGILTKRLRRDGKTVDVVLSMGPLREEDGSIRGVVATYAPISATPAPPTPPPSTTEGVGRQDPLTGLPDRAAFEAKARAMLEQAAARRASVALLLTDLDRFKTVNESLGHPAGDRVLVDTAERMKKLVSAADFVARLGQDQFAVLLPGAEEAGAVVLGRDVMEEIARPFHAGGTSLHLTCSIGVALWPRDGITLDELMKNAERAMERAKTEGIGLRFFDATVDTHGRERLWIEEDLRRALERGRLTLEYQPIIKLPGGKAVGAEALARWAHPDKGPIPPGRFIAVAEESGLIVALDRWVVTTAVRQLGKWRKTNPQAWLTANISPRTLHDPAFPGRVRALLQEFNADGTRLVLEITERVLADPGRTLEIIKAIRAMGVRIAVDDFGTGYSSLVYLQEFPLDFLKVDQQFVRSIGSHEKGQAIARTVIALSHNLGVEALAEGVEMPAQLEWLKTEGCDLAQGYHIGMPRKPEELKLE